MVRIVRHDQRALVIEHSSTSTFYHVVGPFVAGSMIRAVTIVHAPANTTDVTFGFSFSGRMEAGAEAYKGGISLLRVPNQVGSFGEGQLVVRYWSGGFPGPVRIPLNREVPVGSVYVHLVQDLGAPGATETLFVFEVEHYEWIRVPGEGVVGA